MSTRDLIKELRNLNQKLLSLKEEAQASMPNLREDVLTQIEVAITGITNADIFLNTPPNKGTNVQEDLGSLE